ncbi:glutamate--tRNA ligase [Enterobacteriaceae endosymbiont of Donacia bicoloricornis]|uniref:glutamate--tRNA ligase n=1 Tax=Enterobacteriaceae endosymbiont of Donacia bicoloricornis TaxID=2675772 RepID=UPI00144954F6|nr:glutamate--tRNA ligase [Enterobacteriaceae endosymbiont of Donacia bicoloricornis]QJC37562.1 glutamate--tRNA ligase [Enterobacteriaceae endosymbiont of Donacia bicoloricornis]
MKIITRFAPSPTGYLHIGNIRTALYSWLFAKKNKGQFILRIENTDFKRSKKIFIKNIINTLKWLNIDWDKGPFLQSERMVRYNNIINIMLNEGKAYKCFCSKEELEQNKQKQILNKEKIKYNGKCRNKKLKNNIQLPYTVRLRVPKKNTCATFIDTIRGQIIVDNNELDDFIIRRSDGIPTYNFCVVIDDWDMKITHVIRGEEHINNTPKQIHIINAIGAYIPIYTHVSIIKDKSGKKISKRDGNFNILKYKENGYLPIALLNYILRLGWSYGNKEIFSLEEMQKLFNLKNLSKSSSIFDINKLNWFNKYYLSKFSENDIIDYLKKFCTKNSININNGPKLKNLYQIFHKRCNTLKEINNLCFIFYKNPNYQNNLLIRNYLNIDTKIILEIFKKKIIHIKIWSIESINNIFKKILLKLNISYKKAAMTLRLAITGIKNTPPINYIIYLMGREKIIYHINNAINFI